VWNGVVGGTVYLIQPRSETFGICQQTLTGDLLYFVQPRSEKLWMCQQEQLKLTVFGLAAQRKFLEFANKSNSNWRYFVRPRAQRKPTKNSSN
jgi:hypothetical protein